MSDAEWIGFAGLVIAVIGLGIEIIRLRRETKDQRSTLKVMMDYISIRRDTIASIERILAQKSSESQALLEFQKERNAWEKAVTAAKAVGWLYDRNPI